MHLFKSENLKINYLSNKSFVTWFYNFTIKKKKSHLKILSKEIGEFGFRHMIIYNLKT